MLIIVIGVWVTNQGPYTIPHLLMVSSVNCIPSTIAVKDGSV